MHKHSVHKYVIWNSKVCVGSKTFFSFLTCALLTDNLNVSKSCCEQQRFDHYTLYICPAYTPGLDVTNGKMILQWTVRLRGPDMFVGEGCGPSGPRSRCDSHQNVAPLCSLFRVTLMVTNTFTGVRIRLRSQSASFWQPLTCIVPDGTNAYFGGKK